MSDLDVQKLSRALDRTGEGLEGFIKVGIATYGEPKLMHALLRVIAAHDTFEGRSSSLWYEQVHIDERVVNNRDGLIQVKVAYLMEELG